jgi:hypothetical protein
MSFSLNGILLATVVATGSVATTAAQEGESKSVDEVARELSNPVGSTASLVFQGTWSQWGGDLPGADDQSSSALIFLPTLPFKVGSGNLTVRPSFPVAGAPNLDATGWSKERGFGDIVLLAMWGRAEKSGLLWGFGGTAIFPTASDAALGADQWQLGPAALAGHLSKRGVFGALWQHWWGLNDPSSGGAKANTGTLQLFYWFSLSGGWQIGGSPITTANYVTVSDVDLSFPLNFGVAKTLMAGNTPIKATVQAQYFVTQPDLLGPSWGVFFQIAPVVSVPWS